MDPKTDRTKTSLPSSRRRISRPPTRFLGRKAQASGSLAETREDNCSVEKASCPLSKLETCLVFCDAKVVMPNWLIPIPLLHFKGGSLITETEPPPRPPVSLPTKVAFAAYEGEPKGRPPTKFIGFPYFEKCRAPNVLRLRKASSSVLMPT